MIGIPVLSENDISLQIELI